MRCIMEKTSKNREDEEKFFDRITLEMQIASMRTTGFTKQGYVEFKAKDMVNRTVKIITKKEEAREIYLCGIPHGLALVCVIENLVIAIKNIA